MTEYDYEYTGQPLWYHEPIIKMLPYVAKLLFREEIRYWLDWGTLLGAMRNGRMIPWDFDIDIGIFHDDVERLLALTPEIAKDGYQFAVDRNNEHARKIRFFGKEGFDFHIDIDPWIVRGDNALATFDQRKCHPMSELSVLGNLVFEGDLYPCPGNPEACLERLIGPDWRKPKVSSGNMIYIRKHDPDNKDVLAETKKHRGC